MIRAVRSENQYNQLLKELFSSKKYPLLKTQGTLFAKELKEATRQYPLRAYYMGRSTFKQVDVEKDYIKKLLVIKQYGILGFEVHKQKLEKLRVLEGICLLIAS
jgi:hypothetical protein